MGRTRAPQATGAEAGMGRQVVVEAAIVIILPLFFDR
jgi:hypothetical protein